MKFETWQELFEHYREYCVHMGFYECEGAVELEELYQHFKARMVAELMVDVHGTTHYGRLLEREDTGDER